jgi:hypothetical protein
MKWDRFIEILGSNDYHQLGDRYSLLLGGIPTSQDIRYELIHFQCLVFMLFVVGMKTLMG